MALGPQRGNCGVDNLRIGQPPGGAWWNELAQNRGMTYQISSAEEITLSADPGMVLRYAKRGKT